MVLHLVDLSYQQIRSLLGTHKGFAPYVMT
ncbi:hypothetical protein NIES4101_69890 [Calothrix sp. NIES-4101]|nr:hypothetical protein NIES4101_69890 [Calothrix sp. NIES-4101]